MAYYDVLLNSPGQTAQNGLGSFGPGAGAAAASLGSQLIGSAFNAIEAHKNRKWQERMSNTAYQRAVADMEKAGINPALVYGQGAPSASTPSGSAATAAAPAISMAEMLSAKKTEAEISVLESEAARNNAQAGLTEQQSNMYEQFTTAQIDQMRSAVESNEARAALDRAGISQTEASTLLTFYNACMAATDSETRARMNQLHMSLLAAQAEHNNAAAAELLSQIRVNEQGIIESAARVNNFDAQTLNYLEQNGVIRYDKAEAAWRVEHLPADRVWQNAGRVVDIGRELVGMASSAATGVASLQAAGAFAKNAGSLISRTTPPTSVEAAVREHNALRGISPNGQTYFAGYGSPRR